MYCCRVIVCAASLVLLGAVHAAAGPDNAYDPVRGKALEQRGLELYEAGEYAEAARQLEAAFAADPRQDILFAWAQAERLSGNCPAARRLYRQFLAGNPSPAHRRAANQGILRCGLEDEPASPSPAPNRPATPPPEKPPYQPRSWYRDALGGVLLGAGALGAGVGIGLYVAALDAARVEDADDYGEVANAAAVSRRRRDIAAWTGGVGVALLVGAALRYTLAAPDASATPAAGASVTSDAVIITASGRF